MNRLDVCKSRILQKQKESVKEEDLELIYQELINYLPTYKEKRAFSLYYVDLKRRLILT